MDPHFPYITHKEFNFAPNYKGKLPSTISQFLDFDKPDLEYVKACYDSEIRFTDEYVGRVISKLKELGLFDNTIIMVVADHGDEFDEHGGYNHGHTLYQEVLSVPCIVKLPGQRRGRVVGGTFAMIDLLPSVLRYIGFDQKSYGMQGSALDLSRLTECEDKYVFSSLDVAGPLFTPASVRSVQNRRYEYIKYFNKRLEMLFDLVNDPTEQRNILTTEPEVGAKLRKACMDQSRRMDSIRRTAPPEEPAQLNNNDVKLLRSLGYLQ
jgi:arylsulfatase A-like enzyme